MLALDCGDGDDVVWLDFDVLRWVLSLENFLHVQFDAAKLSGQNLPSRQVARFRRSPGDA